MATSGQQRHRESPPLSRLLRWTIGLAITLIATWFIVALLPKAAFSTDLQRIGSGQPVAVLTHESAHPTSMVVMERIEAVHDHVPEGFEFLVASLGESRGREFADRHDAATPGTLIFFDAGGAPGHRLHAPASTDEIIKAAFQTAHSAP